MSWSTKYKKSIDCSNPKGFSQKAHCDGRKARQRGEETKSKSVNEMKLTRSQLKEIIREEIQTLTESKEEMMINIIGSYLKHQYGTSDNKAYYIGKEIVKLFKTRKLI